MIITDREAAEQSQQTPPDETPEMPAAEQIALGLAAALLGWLILHFLGLL